LESQNLGVYELHQAVETQEARVLEVLRSELVLKSAPGTETEVLQQGLRQAEDLG
jgi:hypothetical protein